jgi:hypothetical protein
VASINNQVKPQNSAENGGSSIYTHSVFLFELPPPDSI